MKFSAIEVEDIFAYKDVSRIDLTCDDPNRNIVVVYGRNGAGKTSLLNAIKLLFLGTSDQNLRRVGFGGSPISPKHYVLGQPGRWYGVFNNPSKPSGAPARVALEWSDEDRRYKAQRLFRHANSSLGFTEDLTVTVNGTPLPPRDAEATMLNLLPREVVPFFFFDGEQIQSIADAEIGREQAEIERLLGLSFVAHLTREIGEYAKDKRRAGMPEAVRVKIVNAESAQRDAMARADAAGRARIAVEDEILDLERQKRRLDVERNRLRTGISEEDRARMVSRIEMLEFQRERLATEIAESLPVEAMFLANLGLTREVFHVLDQHAAGAADATLAGRLHRDLPPKLLGILADQPTPVVLSEEQKRAFIKGLGAALEEAGVPANAATNPLLASLSPKQVKSLRDQFLIWNEKGTSLLVAQTEPLRTIRRISAEVRQAQRDLDEAELASEEARQKFEELTNELGAVEAAIREKSDAASEYRIDEQRAQREQEEHSQTVVRLEGEYAEVSRQSLAYQLALRTRKTLDEYRDERRRLIRRSVEARLNDRIGMLLGPSQLIKSVTLDDQFVMSYFDERKNEVARHSISAGMRQLVAMAMLWALKDEAEKPLPVMIDTPLGRIDRENRSLLLTEYFPKAGRPLVLLPTNSEFGEDDFAMIASSIARRYEIRNVGGESAQIIPISSGGAG